MATGKQSNVEPRAGATSAGDPAVEAFLRGDADTVATALQWIRGAVHSKGFYVAHDDRPELVQETMMQLLRHLADPERPRPRSLAAFVRTLAYRRCIDWMRRHQPTESAPPDLVSSDPSPEKSLLSREQIVLGQRVLARLNESCRDLIRRYTYEGATYRQIAEQDGRLEKTVRNQMYKCIDRARLLVDRMAHRGGGRAPGARP